MSTLSSLPILYQQAQKILVILGPEASFDQQLAATSLHQALLAKIEQNIQSAQPNSAEGEERDATFLCPTEINNPTIPGLDLLKNKMGEDKLVITFNYQEEAVGNVSYHIDEKASKFHLTISPQKGFAPLDKNSVEYDYVGNQADLIFLIGVSELDELEHLYYGYETTFEQADVVSLNKTEFELAAVNIDAGQYSSFCEAVWTVFTTLGLELDADLATNLLAGIQYETNNFTALTTTAETFELVAELLRAGARRKNKGFVKEKDVGSEAAKADKLAKSKSKREADEDVEVTSNTNKSVEDKTSRTQVHTVVRSNSMQKKRAQQKVSQEDDEEESKAEQVDDKAAKKNQNDEKEAGKEEVEAKKSVPDKPARLSRPVARS